MKHSEIISSMSLAEKIAFCSGASFWRTKAFEEHGIPSILMTDGPHGLRKLVNAQDALGEETSHIATCFPTASATACSWDRDLLRKMGEALGEEALQEQVSIILGPGANTQRNPLCGRNFEYFSEDPCLAGEMAAAWIQGVQSQGVGTSLKHFAGNSQENLRMTSDSLIDERTLREIYLPAFEKAVKAAQPATVMCAYNKLNGIYCSDHSYLLREILREEWGFAGVIVTDWGAMNDRVKAFEAGLDLEMPGGVGLYDAEVLAAVQSGALSEDRINQSVDRLLDLVLRSHASKRPGYRYDVEAHHRLAREIAAQSGVLLKNEDGILPLQPGQKIALIGALAEFPRYQGAGSSLVNPTHLSNAIDGFTEHGLDFNYHPGYPLKRQPDEQMLEAAVAGAGGSDVAVIFAGLTADYESEGFDRSNMAMPEHHNALIRRVAAVQPNTVVVLAGGAPVEMPWIHEVKGVLNMLLSGQAGGLAAADLLTGKVNPSGKLAATYPLRYADVPSAAFYQQGGRQAQYRESIYVGYRYYDKAERDVLFPFGHGLSYTTFVYGDLKLSASEMQSSDELFVSATIKNAGERSGAEVVQLYVGALQSGVFRPEKELRDFHKVYLMPGEEKNVAFRLNAQAFSCYDPVLQAWIVPEGMYEISLGASSRDIRLRGRVLVHGTARNPTADSLPAWYTRPVGEISAGNFEEILGRPIEPLKMPRRGEYTLSSTMLEMQGSFVIRLVTKILIRVIVKNYGILGPNDPNFRMLVDGFINTPMKNLVVMSKGVLSVAKARAMVDAANGNLGRALRRLVKD